MSNEVNITARDAEMNGSVRLYENYFKNGSEYFGKYERKLITSRTLYARIQKKNAGTNLHEVQKIVGMLKEAVIEAIEAGEAINLMDLMTLYITVDGKIEGTGIENGSKTPLSVKITPSSILKEATKNINIKNVDYAETDMKIERIFNRYTQIYEDAITQGTEVQLEGRRLKIKGQNAGIWLCPVDDNGNIESDESKWIECPVITKNTIKYLCFYVPAKAQADARYRILIKTFWMNGGNELKNAKTAESAIVTVKASE